LKSLGEFITYRWAVDGQTFSHQLKNCRRMSDFWRPRQISREVAPDPSGAQAGEAALPGVLIQPFLQGPEGLGAPGEEDVAEPIEIGAKMTKSGGRIVGEAWVFGLCRYAIERPDAPNEVLVRQRLFPEVVPDEDERAPNVELETPLAAPKLADRRRAAAAVIVVVHSAEREAGGRKDLCQLRRAPVEHLPRIHRHRHSMARRSGSVFALAQPIVQSVAAPITESQCGSGDLAGVLSVPAQKGKGEGELFPSTLSRSSSFSGGLEARGATGVFAPDGSGNMEQSPFE
jgi:hypothetical protein